ncbi:Uncharacterized protein dnm_017220 [Desulfonema magnum]|uniref:Uncharacterized protein n=1 Tax=Desulfonema magnum TaxID=45655 RepID=A0A975GMC6_9BACT|nr:Uncharacterized protein dnm_017220 [Desulfonema magnum]
MTTNFYGYMKIGVILLRFVRHFTSFFAHQQPCLFNISFSSFKCLSHAGRAEERNPALS